MKKKGFFGSVSKSPTYMGSLSVKNTSKKFSHLGIFTGIVLPQKREVESDTFLTVSTWYTIAVKF
jgi:hypothetical protein